MPPGGGAAGRGALMRRDFPVERRGGRLDHACFGRRVAAAVIFGLKGPALPAGRRGLGAAHAVGARLAVRGQEARTFYGRCPRLGGRRLPVRVMVGRVRDGRVVSRGRGRPVPVIVRGFCVPDLCPAAGVRAEGRRGERAARAAREERQAEADV